VTKEDFIEQYILSRTSHKRTGIELYEEALIIYNKIHNK
jgi:hypothetical protein